MLTEPGWSGLVNFSIRIFLMTKLLNRREAAEFLGVLPETLAVWASTKRYDLPYVKVGGRVMYRPSDLDAFINANLKGGNVDGS